ncbi:hypothetical protein GCM10028773_31500 [Spirosoma koreense]
MTFSIGNNGVVPMTGVGPANKMGFGICLSKCALNAPSPLAALSGPLLAYFDLSLNPVTGCIDGLQKDIAIPASTVFDIYVSAVVTEASSATSVNNIGASCNIAPNPSANPQPTDNDFASVYTHTISLGLPVKLTDFSAQAQADRSVLVRWQTSWEGANGKFVVERSKDLKTFDVVGEVLDVAGSSTSLNTYHLVDSSPYRGRSYYRLVQVDQSGREQTFPARWVELEGRYGLYPNPVVRGASFVLELDEPSTAAISLHDSRGVAVGLHRQPLSEVSVQLKPLNAMPSGVYVLQVQERATTRRHRLVVP